MRGSKLIKKILNDKFKPGARFAILYDNYLEPQLYLKYDVDREGMKALYCVDESIGREYICDSGFILNNHFFYINE